MSCLDYWSAIWLGSDEVNIYILCKLVLVSSNAGSGLEIPFLILYLISMTGGVCRAFS